MEERNILLNSGKPIIVDFSNSTLDHHCPGSLVRHELVVAKKDLKLEDVRPFFCGLWGAVNPWVMAGVLCFASYWN